MENSDNKQRLKNVRIRGLEEGLEGEKLEEYLEEITGFVVSNHDCIIQIESDYQIGITTRGRQY